MRENWKDCHFGAASPLYEAFAAASYFSAPNSSSAYRHLGHNEYRLTSVSEKRMPRNNATILIFSLILAFAASIFAQQTETAPPSQNPTSSYQPKFHGDPARSDSEASALAYMRVVIRAQRQFSKQYDHFATSLPELVHSGTFTKRMVNPDRGDYTAGFKGKKDSYVLTMTPKILDAQHRSFYAEDDGKIHADETKAADGDSPVVK
jgi:hypothetical protein